MQAMDRAHRIGQKKTVHVYKLVTSDSIEEHIMKLHDAKLAMTNSIVNTDNSSMFSLGTDRLLDIFKCRSEASTRSSISHGMDRTLDSLVDLYEEEYKTLSIETFIEGLKDETEKAEVHG
jgi:TATA-binding protein-associated factor